MGEENCSMNFRQFWQEELSPSVKRGACTAIDEAFRETGRMILEVETWPALTDKQQAAAFRNARNLWRRRRDTDCTPREPRKVFPGVEELCDRLGDLYRDLFETAAERREIEDPRDWLSKTHYIDELRDELMCR